MGWCWRNSCCVLSDSSRARRTMKAGPDLACAGREVLGCLGPSGWTGGRSSWPRGGSFRSGARSPPQPPSPPVDLSQGPPSCPPSVPRVSLEAAPPSSPPSLPGWNPPTLPSRDRRPDSASQWCEDTGAMSELESGAMSESGLHVSRPQNVEPHAAPSTAHAGSMLSHETTTDRGGEHSTGVVGRSEPGLRQTRSCYGGGGGPMCLEMSAARTRRRGPRGNSTSWCLRSQPAGSSGCGRRPASPRGPSPVVLASLSYL